MDTLLFFIDTMAIIFLLYWARLNDDAGNGPTTGLLAYRSGEAPPADRRDSRNA